MIYRIICFLIGHHFVFDDDRMPIETVTFLFRGEEVGQGKKAYCGCCNQYKFFDKGGF